MARPVPIARLAQGNFAVGVVFTKGVLLASSYILRPVTCVCLFIVKESTNTELLGGGSIPASPVAGAGCLVTEDAIEPVTVISADGWVVSLSSV